MKRGSRVLGWGLCVLALGACGVVDWVDGEPSRLSLKEGRTLEGAACGVEGPACPQGLSCAVVDLDTGSRTLCVDTADVCERLSCGSGQCAILESYPVQIRCTR